MGLLDNPKAAPVLGVVFAGLLGYLFYSGEVVNKIGVQGIPAKQERIASMTDSIARLEAQTDSVKRDLARGTIEDLKRRIESHRGTRLSAPATNLSQEIYVSAALPQTKRVMVKDEDVCLHCGLCAERCPTAAWDMQTFDLKLPYAGGVPR